MNPLFCQKLLNEQVDLNLIKQLRKAYYEQTSALIKSYQLEVVNNNMASHIPLSDKQIDMLFSKSDLPLRSTNKKLIDRTQVNILLV